MKKLTLLSFISVICLSLGYTELLTRGGGGHFGGGGHGFSGGHSFSGTGSHVAHAPAAPASHAGTHTAGARHPTGGAGAHAAHHGNIHHGGFGRHGAGWGGWNWAPFGFFPLGLLAFYAVWDGGYINNIYYDAGTVICVDENGYQFPCYEQDGAYIAYS